MPDGLGDRVRVAEQVAIDSAWQFFVRSAARGLHWDDTEGCETRADYRAKLNGDPALLLETCQALLDYDSGLTDEERADYQLIVKIAAALAERGPVRRPAPVETAPSVISEPDTLPPLPADPNPLGPIPAEAIAEPAQVASSAAPGSGRQAVSLVRLGLVTLLVAAVLAALWMGYPALQAMGSQSWPFGGATSAPPAVAASGPATQLGEPLPVPVVATSTKASAPVERSTRPAAVEVRGAAEARVGGKAGVPAATGRPAPASSAPASSAPASSAMVHPATAPAGPAPKASVPAAPLPSPSAAPKPQASPTAAPSATGAAH